MITICFADNSPVVHHGVKSYFAESKNCKIESFVKSFDELQKFYQKKSLIL